MSIRRLTQLHENPAILALAATRLGRVSVVALASALLLWHWRYLPHFHLSAVRPHLLLMVLVLPVVSAWPNRRRPVLAAAALLALVNYFRAEHTPERSAILVFGALIGIVALLLTLRRLRFWPPSVQRHMVLLLHLTMWIVVTSEAAFTRFSGVAEAFRLLVWRFSYLLHGIGHSRGATLAFTDHFFYLWPVYGPSNPTPIGKGLEYLSRYEAKDLSRMAKSQLAGLKLLIVAAAWAAIDRLFDAVIYGDMPTQLGPWFGSVSLSLPRLAQAMLGNLSDVSLVIPVMCLELVGYSIRIAIYGHVVVGCIRLLGFQVFRHTYRPFLADTIIEFWNRWTYYYKEVLVDFFFYPTFLRCSWAGKQLRLFLAVFASAGLGNIYCNILWDMDVLLTGDIRMIWAALGSRSVYCIILATGIWVSMFRQQHRRREKKTGGVSWNSDRIRAVVGVWSFYAFAHIWGAPAGSLGPIDRLMWLLSVVGLR